MRAAIAALLTMLVATSAGAAVPACDWWVYDAARGEPQKFFTDPDTTPPFALRLDAGIDTPGGTLSERGGLDFDGDGRTDPFRLHLRQDGFYQWQDLRGGSPAGWTDVGAYAGDSLSTLRFGDFDGDGRSDVFSVSSRPVSGRSPLGRPMRGAAIEL